MIYGEIFGGLWYKENVWFKFGNKEILGGYCLRIECFYIVKIGGI